VIRNAFRVLLVLWAGSLWSLAAWVALIIFHSLGDAHLAGIIAGRLFSIETYLGVAVAAAALLLSGRGKMGGVYVAVALLAVNEWILKRSMAAAHSHGSALGLSFGAWHGISAVLYVIACLCVLVVIWQERFR
jgi:hypothetical protein